MTSWCHWAVLRKKEVGLFTIICKAEGGCDEWRFMGKLGFGGKYRSGTNRVDCYSEDETPERLDLIKQINIKLLHVVTKC